MVLSRVIQTSVYSEILEKFLVRRNAATFSLPEFDFNRLISFPFIITGLDFAWSTNGYVYHTTFDNVDQVPLGSLQRTGDNILALVRGITAGHYLADLLVHHQKGSMVFFDFLGAFVVRWPEYLASTINIAGILTGLYSIYLNFEAGRKLGKVKENSLEKH